MLPTLPLQLAMDTHPPSPFLFVCFTFLYLGVMYVAKGYTPPQVLFPLSKNSSEHSMKGTLTKTSAKASKSFLNHQSHGGKNRS